MRLIAIAAAASLALAGAVLSAPASAHERTKSWTRTAVAASVQSNDIVGVAAKAGQFQTLLAAAEAAGLVGALQGQGPLTVFAPTDEAFKQLPAGTVERLLRPENRDELRRLLSYHVVEGRVLAGDLAGRTLRPRTLAGPRLSVDGRQGVAINTARVVTADVSASNGVIHVIDRVLLPPAAH